MLNIGFLPFSLVANSFAAAEEASLVRQSTEDNLPDSNTVRVNDSMPIMSHVAEKPAALLGGWVDVDGVGTSRSEQRGNSAKSQR